MKDWLYDYRDINRGFKRKVNQAKKKGETQLVIDMSTAQNVSNALDALVWYWRDKQKND